MPADPPLQPLAAASSFASSADAQLPLLAVPEACPEGFACKEEERGASWLGASWVLLADVVGTSLLTLNSVAAQLGWILLIAWLLVACLLASHNALLMSETYLLLSRHGITVSSMGEAARHALGSRRAAAAVFVAVYAFAVLGNASYLLIMGQAMQGALGGLVDLDLTTATCISSLCCGPLVCAVRRVRETTSLSFGNSLVLCGAVAIVLGSLAWRGGPRRGTEVVAADLGTASFFGASTNVLYAFASHWLYFELMSEMEEPRDFPKVLLLNGPLQLAIYFATAGVSYYYLGGPASALQAGGLIQDLPRGRWQWSEGTRLGGYDLLLPNATSLAQLLLFVHVGIIFLVKSVVVTRFLVICLDPDSEGTRRGRRVHALCGTGVIALSLALSLALPFFDLFLGLVGGLLAAPISYLLPIVFYLGVLGRFEAAPCQQGLAAGDFLRQGTGESFLSEAVSEPFPLQPSRQWTGPPVLEGWQRSETEPARGAAVRLRRRSERKDRARQELEALIGRRASFLASQPSWAETPEFQWQRLRSRVTWHQGLRLGAIACLALVCSCVGTFAEVRALSAAMR